MEKILRIARKEFASFFSSPVAFIFIGAFLAVNLFVFFWVERFYVTNIAEVRPLFTWMPILLIFLTSAVTMRLWAEERRAGTLEFLLTAPVKPIALVLGKFFGCLGLVIVALILTLPLPISVSFMGPLDWGPVLGGYLAAIFLAAAYIAIGLFVSVKSENQIVSLIVSTLVCSIFYILGSDMLSSFWGTAGGEVLKKIGSGSRFLAITRGVIDVRDLYYYFAIVGVFLSLNIYGLEKLRWAGNPTNRLHRMWQMVTGVCIANFIIANFWLAPLGSLRVDLTQGNIYSISEATRNYLTQLKEPLLLRGYFSAQTHPLLAPLVPRLKDLLEEYAITGGGRINVEFVDPLEHPELEQEAGQKYGIRPIPFQTTSKYQASVTNSYFDILVQYGDQFETLGFGDLIEVKVKADDDLQVELRNPEYDITSAIRKILYRFQGNGDIFSDIGKPITFTGFISSEAQLPDALVSLKKDLGQILDDMQKKAGKLFTFNFQAPESDNGRLAAQLQEKYGFRPMAASLFDQRTFWFYMILQSGDTVVEVPLPQDLDRAGLQRSLDAALKRFASGFTKTVAFNSQLVTPPMPQYGIPGSGKEFKILKEYLEQEHALQETDLKDGYVNEQADLLFLASPEKLDEKQLFAVDQFLMKGGTVILATSPYDIEMKRQLSLKEHDSGLQDWLAFHGIMIDKELVLDKQSSPFPVPVQRNVGGFTVQETRLIDYPYFVDIRPDGMDTTSGILSGIPEITMNWSSPITLDEEKMKAHTVVPLIKSSENSWLSADSTLQPDFQKFGQLGFARGEEKGRQLLGVIVEGSFTSYFKDKSSPLLTKKSDGEITETNLPGPDEQAHTGNEQKEEQQVISRMIDRSPESARIICFSSNSFLADTVISLGSGVRRTGYLEPVQMMNNIIDWSLEDRSLLEIRGRSHFSRPLQPMSKDIQMFYEYLNYVLALMGLLLLWIVKAIIWKKAISRGQMLLQYNSGRM